MLLMLKSNYDLISYAAIVFSWLSEFNHTAACCFRTCHAMLSTFFCKAISQRQTLFLQYFSPYYFVLNNFWLSKCVEQCLTSLTSINCWKKLILAVLNFYIHTFVVRLSLQTIKQGFQRKNKPFNTPAAHFALIM